MGTERVKVTFENDDTAGDREVFYLDQVSNAARSRLSAIESFMELAKDNSHAGPAKRRTALKFDGSAKVKVDPKKHCLYIGIPPYEGCDNGTLRIELDKGVTYTVRCSGEAIMSTETGEFADPYPGLFFAYQSDEQDCLGVNGTDQFQYDGILHVNSRVRLSDVIDGTSNTLLVGERPPTFDRYAGWLLAGSGWYPWFGSADVVLGTEERIAVAGESTPTGPQSYYQPGTSYYEDDGNG